MNYKFKEKTGRGSLNEGRSFGIGFAVCKLNGDTIEGVTPFTTCKDYFNDLCYVENTGINLTKVYGFKHKHKKLLEDSHIYLAVRALHYNHNENWNNQKQAEEILIQNQQRLLKNVNRFEKKLNVEDLAEIVYNDNETIVFKFDKKWLSHPFYISLITLFIRIMFDEKDNRKGFSKLFAKRAYISADNGYKQMTLKNFYDKVIHKKKKFELNYSSYDKTTTGSHVHNKGFIHFQNEILKNNK